MKGRTLEQVVDQMLSNQPELPAVRVAKLAGCSSSYVYARKRLRAT